MTFDFDAEPGPGLPELLSLLRHGLEAMTRPQLAALAERERRLADDTSHEPLKATLLTIAELCDAEMRRRDHEAALDRARFDVIAAELRPRPDDLTGDVSGLPSWSQKLK